MVARACTSISAAVGKGALGGVLGDAGTGNVQGEAQKKLDVLVGATSVAPGKKSKAAGAA